LTRANYQVAGDPENLFGDPGVSEAEYLVAGQILDAEINICYPGYFRGVYSKVEAAVYLKIGWQIYDPFRQELVYEAETEGSSAVEVAPSGEGLAIDKAFSSAVKNLLARRDFNQLVSDTDRQSDPVTARAGPPLNIAARDLRPSDGRGLENEPLSDSVAVIRSAAGHGSGFLIAPGILMTNAHVIGNLSELKIVFGDGAEYDGRVLLSNGYRDIALVSIADRTRRPLALATYRPKAGQEVYSYGAPLDQAFSGTLRRGIVSAYRVTNDLEFLQSDVPTNPGNSGGPLFDEDGNVVAVAVAGIIIGESPQDISFFIPIDSALISLGIGWPSS
jgi:S1-C subfamily serine protease